MTRIFGVQRSKQMEKINIKNRMTGHVFFIRLVVVRELEIVSYI